MLRDIERELLQKIEDIMNDFCIPDKQKEVHIRAVFDEFYKKLT